MAMVQLRAVSNRRSGLCFVYSRDASEAEHLGMHVPGGSKWAGGFGHRKELEKESREEAALPLTRSLASGS